MFFAPGKIKYPNNASGSGLLKRLKNTQSNQKIQSLNNLEEEQDIEDRDPYQSVKHVSSKVGPSLLILSEKKRNTEFPMQNLESPGKKGDLLKIETVSESLYNAIKITDDESNQIREKAIM